jgi:integrase
VKFPKRIKFRGRPLATIYRPSKSYPNYRVAWTAGGRRMMKAFHRYGDAKEHADQLARELAKGSQVPMLTPGQASDAVAALERLQRFYVDTGRRVSLLASVSEYCEAAGKLAGRTVGDAVDGYMANVAAVRAKNIQEAVEEFIAEAEPKTKAKDGKRSKLSPKYFYNWAIMLRRFAGAFKNTSVNELTKELINVFFGSEPISGFTPKTRNHHRTAVTQFLAWAVAKDYLSPQHRLGESVGLKAEDADEGEIAIYAPVEFKALLGAAEGPMQAMIAIGGLAGLRTEELFRLTWADVWRVPGHIEVTALSSKTRARRLIPICPSLQAWLEPFRPLTEGKLTESDENRWHKDFNKLCEQASVEVKGKRVPVARKTNGLRHSFCSYHLAMYGNEGLTAIQAGNSPQMVFRHYRKLVTRSEAEQWFAVAPARPANVIALAGQNGAQTPG